MKKRLKDINKVLHLEDLLYVLKIIRTEQISKYNDNLLVCHFDMKKTWELIAYKYYLLIVKANIESYIKRYNIYLASIK